MHSGVQEISDNGGRALSSSNPSTEGKAVATSWHSETRGRGRAASTGMYLHCGAREGTYQEWCWIGGEDLPGEIVGHGELLVDLVGVVRVTHQRRERLYVVASPTMRGHIKVIRESVHRADAVP